jgi:16S rRNA (guanine1207-N2)-methyltransferase
MGRPPGMGSTSLRSSGHREPGIWDAFPEALAADLLENGIDLLLSYLNPVIVPGPILRTVRAFLVVHKHLGGDSLTAWTQEQGFPTRRIGSKSGFRVLEVASAPGE